MKKKRTGASGLFPSRACPSYRFVRVANPSRKLDLSWPFFPFAAFSPLSSSSPHFYSKYRGSATREEEEEEVSRPIVMHDYSLRYRGAPRGYIRDLQFLCQIPARASFSRVRRRVVELWEAAVAAAAAPCHCLKFSYPGWIRPMFYSAARTDAVLILHFREQGYKLIGTRFTIFSPSSLSFRFNSAKSSLKRRGSRPDLRSFDAADLSSR